MQKMLKDLGVDLSIVEKPSSEFSRVFADRDFDVVTMSITSSEPFGVTYFKYTYGSDSQLNKSGTGTPELDEQIAELEKLPTQEEQIQKANALEK